MKTLTNIISIECKMFYCNICNVNIAIVPMRILHENISVVTYAIDEL